MYDNSQMDSFDQLNETTVVENKIAQQKVRVESHRALYIIDNFIKNLI